MERERYGGRGGSGGVGGGGGGINRYPDVSGRTRSSLPPREDRAPVRREDRPASATRSSNEPWSDVPPELEALLRAQVAAKPAPSRSSSATSSAPGIDEQRPVAADASTPDAGTMPKSRATRKPAATGDGRESRRQAPGDPQGRRGDRGGPRLGGRRCRDIGARVDRTGRGRREAACDSQACGAKGEGGSGGARRDAAGRRGCLVDRRAEAPHHAQDGSDRTRLIVAMEGARTRGQAAALDAVAAMIRGPAPQAVLFVGPDGVGKTTLALDLAAGLLCTAAPSVRPCRVCRACRLVEHGSHPDLHRLGPVGPGRQVVIGGPEAKYRGVKDLIGELSLMPVEGGARVAIVEGADRMNEDAQSALLKTLEEPPAGVTIALCADQEARLLPTVRSRCFRVRLGLVNSRDIERIVADHDLADPPTAAPARSAGGGSAGPGPRLCARPGRRPDPGRAHPCPARPDRCPPVSAAGCRPGRRTARDRAVGAPDSRPRRRTRPFQPPSRCHTATGSGDPGGRAAGRPGRRRR